MSSNQNESSHMTRGEIMRQKRLQALTRAHEEDEHEEEFEEPVEAVVVETSKKRVKRVVRATPEKEPEEPKTPGAPRKRTRARKNSKDDDMASVDTAASNVTQEVAVEPVENLEATFEAVAEMPNAPISPAEIADMWNEHTDTEPETELESEDEKPAEPAPKKRGRKPKLDENGQPVKTKKQLAMEAARAHAMSLPFDATAPKKRGRKPKVHVEGEEPVEKKETKKRPRKSNAEKQAIENKKHVNKMVNVFVKDMAVLMGRVRNMKKPENGPKEYVDMLNEIVQRCTQDVKELAHGMTVHTIEMESL